MRTLATIFGVLLLASMPDLARAGIIVDVELITRNFLPPEASLTGFAGVQVDVHTDDGALISAVDVKFEGALHQRWNGIVECGFVGTCETPRGLPANGRGDSLLTLPSNALLGTLLFEDNTGDGSPLPNSPIFYYGLGTTLSGAWGIPGFGQGATASIAYLVIPNGQSVQFNWQVATSSGTFLGTTVIPVPEPGCVRLGAIAYLLTVIPGRWFI